MSFRILKTRLLRWFIKAITSYIKCHTNFNTHLVNDIKYINIYINIHCPDCDRCNISQTSRPFSKTHTISSKEQPQLNEINTHILLTSQKYTNIKLNMKIIHIKKRLKVLFRRTTHLFVILA